MMAVRYYLLIGRCIAALIVLLGMRPADGIAQPDSTETVPPKYWLFFTDNPSAKTAPLDAARAPTPRAEWRRRLRGRTSAPQSLRLNADCRRALIGQDIRLVVTSRWLNAVSAHLTLSQRTSAEALDCVRSVQPVASTHPMTPPPGSPLLHPAISYGPSERQLTMINAQLPLERDVNGRGVRVGFLDTEYGAFMHPVFDALRAEGRVIDTRNFTGRSQANRHGRMVASVALGYAPGELVGPAHGAEVLGTTTEYVPFERNQEEDFFVAGLEWLEAQGADVVNVSLGYTTFDEGESDYTPADLDGDTAVTTRAVDIAASLGVVVAVSAGNEACSAPDNCWYYISTPADADSAIAVAAVDPDSSRSPFSSFGPTADGRTKPGVAAPGRSVRIAGANGSYRFGSGTSFASPLVAGVAAQMLQVNPELNPIDIRRLLRESASQAQQPDNALGWGIIDADAAVRAAEALRDPPPDTPVAAAPYPNPTTDRAVFEVRMPDGGGRVELHIYNTLGREVYARHAELNRGTNQLTVDVRSLASGLYLYLLTSSETDLHQTGKLTVVH